jgi:hypothetical protein
MYVCECSPLNQTEQLVFRYNSFLRLFVVKFLQMFCQLLVCYSRTSLKSVASRYQYCWRVTLTIFLLATAPRPVEVTVGNGGLLVDRGSSVDVATFYGLDGPAIESWRSRDFPHPSRPALGPTQPPEQWVPSFLSGGKAAGD